MSRRPDRPRERSSWWTWPKLLLGAAAVLVPELIGNLLANSSNRTPIGGFLNDHPYLGYEVLFGLVVIGGIGYAVTRWLDWLPDRPGPHRGDEPDDVTVIDPEPQELPQWERFPIRLRGRDKEVDQAIGVLRYRSMVVIAGTRDVGTSSVANMVVAKLLDDEVITTSDAVVWVDLRGRSTAQPPDPRSVAARLLSTFDEDEPADNTEAVLADAAARLIAVVRERATVLLLDNVFRAEQVEWLTSAWAVSGALPMLIVAGDRPVANAVRGDVVVRVDELSLPAMRSILSDELGETRLWRIAGMVRDATRDLRGDRSEVDEMLRMCRGRPRAVGDIARLIRMSNRKPWTLKELMADATSGNEPMVALWRAWLPKLVDHTLSPRAKALVRALAVLPITGLDRDALHAMLSHTDPGDGDVVDELRQAGTLEESPHGRFRLPEEVRLAMQRYEPPPVADDVWESVSLLVQHYALRAGRWAAALGSVTETPSAITWLHREEPLLRALLTDWRPEATPPSSIVEDLAIVADALDVWYVRELQSDGLVRSSRGLATLAADAERDDLVRLAMLRTAAAHRIGTHLELAERAMTNAEPDGNREATSAALWSRWHNERGLIEFDRATGIVGDRPAARERLQAAEIEFRAALADVPEDDLAGRLCVLINIAATHIELGRLPVALDFLDHAELVAELAEDLSGAAHVAELQGVAAIQGGNRTQAVTLWQRALASYRGLGEEQGQARCLQHLGSLAVVHPDVAGLLDTGQALPVGPDRAATVAHDYLSRSKRLLAGQPSSEILDFYLDIAERRLR